MLPHAEDSLSESAPLASLAEEFALPIADLSSLDVSADALALVPPEFARDQALLPLHVDAHRLQIALADPLNVHAPDVLAHRCGRRIEIALAPRAEILRAIDRCYGLAELVAANPENTSAAPPPATIDTPAEALSDASVIQRVHALIVAAVRQRASDIHLEPLECRFRVRYRIDGALIEVEDQPRRLHLALVSRVKIMADISIAEKRIPQDGRIQIALDGRALDLRVSSLPTTHGESIVMRILDQQGLQLGLPELGFWPDDRAAFERVISSPSGLVLVTGPTGSGKTTTLYSCLHHLNRADRKIITVEDPVEYQLTGINQVPVRPELGMTFAAALRAMLRQAPNVIMLGEIRDRETAEIALNASLTGHLVFSTLHTNDAAGAVTRLVDLGVKRFLISTSLRAVLAQRLVRKICEKCRRPFAPAAHELHALGPIPARHEPPAFARGVGCVSCQRSGYRGRLGLFELLVCDEPMQRTIHDGARLSEIRTRARASGLRTLREDGARKASAGLTTLDEVVSITAGDPR